MKRTRGWALLAAGSMFVGVWGYGNRAHAQFSPSGFASQSVDQLAVTSDSDDPADIAQSRDVKNSSKCGFFRASRGKDDLTPPPRPLEIDDPMARQMNLLYETVDEATGSDSGGY